jgi:hypothetical protein
MKKAFKEAVTKLIKLLELSMDIFPTKPFLADKPVTQVQPSFLDSVELERSDS